MIPSGPTLSMSSFDFTCGTSRRRLAEADQRDNAHRALDLHPSALDDADEAIRSEQRDDAASVGDAGQEYFDAAFGQAFRRPDLLLRMRLYAAPIII
jgi:hypothetical protein